MKSNILTTLILLFFIFGCNQTEINNEPPTEDTELTYVNPFPNLNFYQPVDIQFPPDESNRLFVVEKRGRINVFENNENAMSSTFLSIQGQVYDDGEMGLLGLAFHPDYLNNGYFYVNYNPAENMTRISRFMVSATNPNIADQSSEFVLLEFNQPSTVHNGGQLFFAGDGYLYISTGDGGPPSNGQDTSNLLGSVLRIDVDNMDNGLNYRIPASNPFIGDNNVLDEIYAFGLRNPWRMSYDQITNSIWTGDVGSSRNEEINIIESGGNYGWPRFEGTECLVQDCDDNGLTEPVLEYDNDEGAAITGGYIYRGSLNPDLTDKYIYADAVKGLIWALDTNNFTNETLFDVSLIITSFGIDRNNELYFCDYIGGEIYRFEQE